MPRPRCALPVRHDLRAPGYGALSSHLGSSGNPPLAAQPFSDSFVSYTDNPMMQTRGKKIIREPSERLVLQDIRE